MSDLEVTDFHHLDELRKEKWDLLDQVAAVELAITALVKKIREKSKPSE